MGCDTASADAPTVSPSAVVRDATMPRPPSVLSQDRLQVLCVLSAERADRLKLQAELCEAAAAAARRTTRLPVEVIGVGDPKLLDPTALSLLVHASVGRVGAQDVLTMAVRAYQVRVEQAEIFGPPPIALPFANSIEGAIVDALDRAVQAVLP